MTSEEKDWLIGIERTVQRGKLIPHDMIDTVRQLVSLVREKDDKLHGRWEADLSFEESD